MPNVFLKMTMQAGRLKWTEQHWYYTGPITESGSTPKYSQVTPTLAQVAAAAVPVVTARSTQLGQGAKMVRAIVCDDSGNQNYQPLPVDSLPLPTGSVVTDCELAALVEFSSSGEGNFPEDNYSGEWYQAGLDINDVNGQFLAANFNFSTATTGAVQQFDHSQGRAGLWLEGDHQERAASITGPERSSSGKSVLRVQRLAQRHRVCA